MAPVVELSATQAKKLAADPAVESVAQNQTFAVSGTWPRRPRGDSTGSTKLRVADNTAADTGEINFWGLQF